ncbi:unnamed protein product [Ranitomeya imitator]|uniref:Uncharacterized protein n=1 Tax=Ranitomeya imitator TaxID=111125 RepID=A0ABN9L8N8_9NEOB|nr:unnamed protein product [Ranitomeya imitator]
MNKSNSKSLSSFKGEKRLDSGDVLKIQVTGATHRIALSPSTDRFHANWVGGDITGMTLGIVGMGRIGYKIAQRAKAFEMKILYHNRNRRMTENKELPGALVEEIGGPNGVMEEHLDFLKERFTLITLKELKENKEELAEKIVCIFNWGNKPDVDSELLRCLPRLKVVASAGAGVDHLDIKMISSFGVKVANTPHAVTNCTADLAMTLLLVAARNFMEGNRQHIPQHFTIKRGHVQTNSIQVKTI